MGMNRGNNREIIFKDEEHEMFYRSCLPKCRQQDVYHKALVYCLGVSRDTRRNIERIFDFKRGSVKPKCLEEGWATNGSARVVRMAFNLFCNAYQEAPRAKKAKRKRKRERERMQKEGLLFLEDQDDTFYYIAGYTSGGAPYGVTWEEMGLEPGMEDIDG